MTFIERRAGPRNRQLKSGTIEFNGGAIDCVVRNASTSGAALEVASPLGIPDQFTLVIANDRTTRRCRLVWRSERRIGVMFAAS